MKQTWRVPDDASLQTTLRRVNVDVPSRASGRTTNHVERFSVARLLATIACELAYPLELVHDDRPDFVLTVQESQIGIEHTEVVPENVARASFLREKGYGPEVYFLPHASFGEQRKSTRKIKSEISQNKSSGGWYGNASEVKTAEAIAGFAQRKCVAARKQGYRLFHKNWLLMYHNWPAPVLDLAEAARMAHDAMVAQGCFDTFDRVYVVRPSKLAAINLSGAQVVELVDPGVEC